MTRSTTGILRKSEPVIQALPNSAETPQSRVMLAKMRQAFRAKRNDAGRLAQLASLHLIELRLLQAK